MATLPNTEYIIAEERVRRYVSIWRNLFGLDRLDLVLRFHPDLHPTDTGTVAETATLWQYQSATMHWYLGQVTGLSDEELERYVIHEFVHVILAPMESHVLEKFEEQREFAVESMTKAISQLTEKMVDLRAAA